MSSSDISYLVEAAPLTALSIPTAKAVIAAAVNPTVNPPLIAEVESLVKLDNPSIEFFKFAILPIVPKNPEAT